MGVNLGSAWGEIIIDTSGIQKGLKSARDEVKDFEKSLATVGKTLTVAGAVMTGLATKVVLTAARTEELGVVMRNMAKSAGVSEDALEKQEAAIKALGITTQVADTLLIQFMRYQLDAAQATDLARLAQDAAVIAMQDSSQALEGLLHGIVTYNPRVLRTYGIMVDLQQAFLDYAHSTNQSVLSLTAAEKQQIALNEVLKQGGSIAGTYEAAMDTAGKQLRSMSRHVQEASNQFGQHLLPALGAVVEAGTGFLKWLEGLPAPVQATVAQVGALGGGLATLAGGAALVIPKLAALGSAVSGLAAGMGLSTAALLGPLGLIAALGTLVVYSENVKKAHREEAAEILKSTESYEDYQKQIHRAGLESYALSESLYDVAKAAQAAGESFDAMELQDARHDVFALANSWADLHQVIPGVTTETTGAAEAASVLTDEMVRQISKMSDLELVVAANKEEMYALGRQMGYSKEEAMAFAEAVSQAAKAQEAARQNTVTETEAVKRWVGWQRQATEGAEDAAEATGRAAEATGRLGGVMGGLGPKVEAAAEALSKVAIEAANAAAAEEAFEGQLDLLHEAIKGEVGQAYDEFVEKNADAATKIEELTAKIAELEGKKVLTADQYSELEGLREELGKTKEALDEETAAFERNINAIIYNIAEKQILDALEKGLIEDVNNSGTAYDEASTALVMLAEKLGLVDEGTLALTQSVQGQVEKFIDGETSAYGMAGGLGALSGSLADAAAQGAGLADSLNGIPRNVDVSVNITSTWSGPTVPVGPDTGTPGNYGYMQHGGQFRVKGPGGIDRVPVFFRATAGEVVTVTPPGGTPPPDPTGGDRTYEALMALVTALERTQGAGAGGGPASQYLSVYGGLHLAGVNDVDSLLGQLAGLSV